MNQSIDGLTGLISGAALYEEAEILIAKEEEFTLIVLDIDSLFSLNRDFGHAAGDDVFRMIARHIKDVFPAPCLAFRGNRDEFDVLLPGSGKEEAFLKAEQLRKLICEEKLDYTSAEGAALTQSVSVGVASYPDDGSRFTDVYRRADSAMVRAKKAGRNRVYLAREEKLIPKTSHYTAAQLEKLSLVAEKINVGEAALLREALDHLLRRYDVDDVR
jgi:diguanylate cyclase (GGDEF)-like protein